MEDAIIGKYIVGIRNINSNSEKEIFTQKFVRNINSSPIPQFTKAKLRSGISVALGSSVLWNKSYFLNNYIIL